MSTYSDAIGVSAARPSTRVGLLAAFRNRLDSWLQRAAVRAELQGLDSRTLADIGISRSDFPSIVAGTYRDPYGR